MASVMNELVQGGAAARGVRFYEGGTKFYETGTTQGT
jgi:hypothetical protein